VHETVEGSKNSPFVRLARDQGDSLSEHALPTRFDTGDLPRNGWAGFRPYFVAVASTAVAAGIHWLCNPFYRAHHLFLFFTLSNYFLAWSYGWRPACTGMLLGLAATAYFFASLRGEFELTMTEYQSGILAYLVVTGVGIAMTEARRNAQHRTEVKAKQLMEEIAAHKITQENLRLTNSTLEAKVRERTTELTEINSRLREQIATRQEIESKLRGSEQRLIEAQRVSQIGSWEWNFRTNVLNWSDEQFHLHGLVPRESDFTYDDAMAYLLPEDAKRVRQVVDKALSDRRPFSYDYRVRLPDGSIRFMHGKGKLFLGDDGEPVRIAGTAQDITERKQIEAEWDALHQQVVASREKFRVISGRLILAQEEERRKLAGELHDEIGQVLTAVSLSIEVTKGIVDQAARARLDECLAVVDRAIDQVRNLSLNLRPAMLDVMGIESALRWFIGRQEKMTGLKIELHSSMVGQRAPADVETACFRVVQEAITNVTRYAEARSVRVELTRNGPELLLAVQDDGIGFDVAASRQRATTGSTFGLLGMEERIRHLGGNFEIDSVLGRGTTVHVRLRSAWKESLPQERSHDEGNPRPPG